MAIDDASWTLSRLENVELKPEPAVGKSMGRTTPLTDAQLTSRRDQLVQLLENAWGQIGWPLRQARTPQDIQKALAGVEFIGFPHLLAPFARTSEAKPDAAKIRALRQQIGKRNKAIYKVFDKQQRTAEALRHAEMAVSQCSKANLKILRRELERRKRQVKRTNERYSTLNQGANALRAEVESIEAAYAQSQLLSLVKTKRYSYTPLHLADGMAGLPYMGWRQSASRCYREDMRRIKLLPKEQRKQRCQVADGLWYTIFLMIRKVIEPTKKAGKITSELADAIDRMNKSKKRYVKDFLIENWYFLKCAIQDESKANAYSKSFPFRVTAAFQKGWQAQSPEDQVLREIESQGFKKKGT